jgi:hypothetical protein
LGGKTAGSGTLSISFDLTDEFEEVGTLSTGYKPGRSDDAVPRASRDPYRIIPVKTGNHLIGLQKLVEKKRQTRQWKEQNSEKYLTETNDLRQEVETSFGASASSLAYKNWS